MHAHKVQKHIVQVAFSQQELPKGHKALQAYKFLVEYRFFEVLKNAYPIFTQIVDEQRFEKVVIEFMQHGAKSNVMWKVPNEFRKFVKKQKHFDDIPYVHELLWFEWTEVALMMKNYKLDEEDTFSWQKAYSLSKSATIKKLKYKVFQEGAHELKGEYFLLAYYDFREKRVYYRQIGEPLYLFLKILKKKGLQEALEYISQLSGEQQNRVKEFFTPSLEELLSLHIIKRSLSC